jgi:hypothetical protein
MREMWTPSRSVADASVVRAQRRHWGTPRRHWVRVALHCARHRWSRLSDPLDYSALLTSVGVETMSKRKHHFVPRFYLKNFESEPRRIHMYNLERQRAFSNVSLRDQCYQYRFYGKTDEVENELMEVEGKMAPIIRETIERRILPLHGSKEHYGLLAFAVLQALRTAAAADEVRTSSEQFTEAVFGPAVEFGGMAPEDVPSSIDDPVELMLGMMGDILTIASDLQMHLVCTGRHAHFITSDNPVFQYNFYCEGTKGKGTLGWGQHGFQVFVPLSPSTLLVVFDPRVYKLGSRRFSVTDPIPNNDVDTLNRMQLIGASENVYFSEWKTAAGVARLHKEAQSSRNHSGPKVLEYVDERDVNHSLLHSFHQMPNLKLQLSFMSIRRDARRVPFLSRSRGVRRPELSPPTDSGELLVNDGRDHVRFVRPDHHPILRKNPTARFRRDDPQGGE